MADALPHGAAPSGNLSTRSIWNHRFVCPTVLPQMLCPWNLLGWLSVQVPFSLKFSPLKTQVAGSTGPPDQCALCGSLCSATVLQRGQPKPLPGVPRLFYTWEFPRSVGNKDPSGNAALTHPLHALTESFNPWLFSQRHLESSLYM